MPAWRKYCQGWCDRVGKPLCAPGRRGHKAVILLFITRRARLLAKSDANGLWVAISLCSCPLLLCLGRPAAYLKDKFLRRQLLPHIRGQRWSREHWMRAALLPR